MDNETKKSKEGKCKITTVRVAEYTAAGAASVPFILLSDKYKVEKSVTQVGRDRITPLLSVEGGFSATANLGGLPTNPIFQYTFWGGNCGLTKITVIQLFILRTISAPSVTTLFSGTANSNISAPPSQPIPVLWNSTIVAPGVTYNNTNGVLTFNSMRTNVSFTLNGTIENPSFDAFLNIIITTSGGPSSTIPIPLSTSPLNFPTLTGITIPADTTLSAEIQSGTAIGNVNLNISITQSLLA